MSRRSCQLLIPKLADGTFNRLGISVDVVVVVFVARKGFACPPSRFQPDIITACLDTLLIITHTKKKEKDENGGDFRREA